jgi:2-amino-4-hydroxy-6-hydroxymethyldihydropteridine diphosphokinase
LSENINTKNEPAVVVALGGNLPGAYPSSTALLEAALAMFATEGLTVTARSRWWRSAAWPDPTAPAYTNGVAIVETALSPRAVLEALNRVERAFGRVRGEANAARTLDLDMIAYQDLVFHEPGLTLPHPRAHERLFVMGPLAQVAPSWRHPRLDRTAAELAAAATVGLDAGPIA